jgi:acetylglutamate kinase
MNHSTRALATEKAAILVEALPYIRTYRGEIVVVKLGGEAVDDDAQASLVADDIALMTLVGIRVVVVHGGGPQISAALAEAGVESRFVSGLRVTTSETIDVVRRVLVGSINPELVARLNSVGVAAVGISGGDGNLIVTEPAEGPNGEDLGRVGRVASIDISLLHSLLDQSYTPVVASIAPGTDGGPTNVNADEVAGAIAGAMGAAKLVYLTNVEGLYRDLGDAGSLVSELKASDLKAMLGSLSSGMAPKATSIVDALEAGVGKAHILDGRIAHALLLEVFTDEGIGTQVLAT